MNHPKVTIICACYNQSQYILESLESIKNQTFKDFEVIIWDDASSDNSVSIIDKWILENPQISIQFIKHTQNLGICKSLNECHALAKGKYIQLIALDDVMLPWKLETQVDILENSSEEYAMIFSDAYIIDSESNVFQNKFIALHKKYLNIESGNFLNDLIEGNFIPIMSVLFKSSVFESIGKWDEDLTFEDYDMLLRLSRKYKFLFMDKPTVKYRMHSNNFHKVFQKEMSLSTFKLLLKHSDIETVYLKLKDEIEIKFLNNSRSNEAQLFYARHTPKNFLDKYIWNKYPIIGYKILKKLFK